MHEAVLRGCGQPREHRWVENFDILQSPPVDKVFQVLPQCEELVLDPSYEALVLAVGDVAGLLAVFVDGKPGQRADNQDFCAPGRPKLGIYQEKLLSKPWP